MAKLSKDDILEAVDAMTVLELAELVEALKDKYNVTAAQLQLPRPPRVTVLLVEPRNSRNFQSKSQRSVNRRSRLLRQYAKLRVLA